MGGGGHPLCDVADCGDRVGLGAQRLDGPQRARPELLHLLCYPLGMADRASPQASFGEVDLMPRQPGKRRAEEREQRGTVGAQPREAEQRTERRAVGGAREPGPTLEPVGDAGGAEGRLEKPCVTVEARADDGERLGLRTSAQQVEELVRDQLQRAAGARAFEEANRTAELHGRGRGVGEKRTLEVGERRVRDLAEARR